MLEVVGKYEKYEKSNMRNMRSQKRFDLHCQRAYIKYGHGSSSLTFFFNSLKKKEEKNCIANTSYNHAMIILSLKVKVAQLCPTLRPHGLYTVHGILQVRVLEWVAFPFSRGSSQPRNQTVVSGIAGGFFSN